MKEPTSFILEISVAATKGAKPAKDIRWHELPFWKDNRFKLPSEAWHALAYVIAQGACRGDLAARVRGCDEAPSVTRGKGLLPPSRRNQK